MTPPEALAVAAQFGLAVDDAHVVALPDGYSNENVRVDTPGGSFVVRRYGRLHVTRDAIAFEHAIVEHAAVRMPEVVAPLRDAAGETILKAPSGGLVSISPYIAGETGRRDLPTAQAAIAMLARFHRATSDVHVGSGMRTARFVGTMSWLRERFVRFAADRVVGRAVDWNALIAGATATVARVAPVADRLPAAIVHGDLNPDNVVAVDAGAIAGLIDFDFVHETERIYDVGIAVDEFARGGDDEPLDLARIAPLVEAYAAELPLSPPERAALPDALLRHAAMLAWYVATRHGERAPGDVGNAARYAGRVAEIGARADEIRTAAGG
jgi:Ser/Thr protein kinase RdoA (MazF antagonist)